MISYLALEGIDGAGKDSQLQGLARSLEVSGITPIVLHEPSYGEYGRALRSQLSAFPDDPDVQRRMFDLDRADHWQRKIRPALAFVRANEGFVILQNRSILSSAAYQPLGEGDHNLLDAVRRQAEIAPLPDVVVLLDVDVRTALSRMERRNETHDFEDARTLEAVRRRYLRLVELVPGCIKVDGVGEPGQITEAILNAVGLPDRKS